MGLLTCKIHGQAGAMSNVSMNICDSINKETPIDRENIKTINVSYYDDDGEYLFNENYFFTNAESKKLNLIDNYKISTDKEELYFRNLIKNHTGITCVECFKDYMKSIELKYNF